MCQGATLINTARGAIVREAELVAVLERRPDLQAVLDVTDPEPPLPGSPLLHLPNVVRTPHIAGAIGPERRRLGRGMVEELRRYVRGKPLRWEVRREQIEHMAIP
jgi:phosphoglycerate dehydrogenase-like enzyme